MVGRQSSASCRLAAFPVLHVKYEADEWQPRCSPQMLCWWCADCFQVCVCVNQFCAIQTCSQTRWDFFFKVLQQMAKCKIAYSDGWLVDDVALALSAIKNLSKLEKCMTLSMTATIGTNIHDDPQERLDVKLACSKVKGWHRRCLLLSF